MTTLFLDEVVQLFLGISRLELTEFLRLLFEVLSLSEAYFESSATVFFSIESFNGLLCFLKVDHINEGKTLTFVELTFSHYFNILDVTKLLKETKDVALFVVIV